MSADEGQASRRAPRFVAHSHSIGDSASFGRIAHLLPIDDKLVILDRFIPPYIVIADLRTGMIVGRVGKSGWGPREFRAPGWLTRRPGEGRSFWVYDHGSNRLVQLTIAEHNSSVEFGSHIVLRAASLEPVWAKSGILTTGAFPDQTLLRLDPQGQPIEWLISDPPYPSTVVPHLTGRARLNRSRIAIDPSGSRLALFYQSVNRIDFWSADGTYLNTRSGPQDVRPAFRTWRGDAGRDLFAWEPDNEFGYVSAYGTDSRLYALFCGSCRRERRLARTVHVFSWTGELLDWLELDSGVVAIAVSSDDAQLFGGSDEPFPMIHVWKLGDTHTSPGGQP